MPSSCKGVSTSLCQEHPQKIPKERPVLKEFLRRTKTGGHSNRKNYSCKDRLERTARVERGWSVAGTIHEPGGEGRSQVPMGPACPAQKQDFILTENLNSSSPHFPLENRWRPF